MAKVGKPSGGGGNGGGSLALTGITPDSGLIEGGMTHYGVISSFLKTTAGAIGLALLMAGPAGAAPIESPPGGAPAAPPGAAVAKARADLDGDRIEDALGARLAASQAGDQFDVIVMFEGPDAVGRGRAAAGPFAVTREFSIINGFQAQLTAPQIRGLSRAPGLFRISGNGEVTAHDIPSNDDMGATDARLDFTVGGIPIDGSGVTICVIDTGIDGPHELFETKGPLGGPLGPDEFYDAVNGLANPYDDNGHGSHVSGIAAGNGTTSLAVEAIGVAPGASLVVAKVLDANGSGNDATVLAGIDYCAGRGDVDILSMSLGGPTTDGTDPMSVAVNCVADPSPGTCSGNNDPKIIVVSAGNSGALWSTIGAPGVAELAITVGSIAEWSGDSLTNWQDDGLYLNTFSSRGPVIDELGNSRIKPDIVGPGSRVLSAYVFDQNKANEYGIASGTSMSAPFVTGVIALMLQADPTLGVADAGGLPHVKVRGILTSTAKDLGADGPDNEYGHGVIDAYSAVAEASGAVGYAPNAYPGYIPLPGETVADSSNWTYEFTVTPELVGLPIAGSAIIDGTFVQTCLFWFGPDCFLWDSLWSPDLEIILEEQANNGTWSQVTAGSGEVTLSECPAYGECGQVGRSEVVHFVPSATGTFRFRVFPFDDGTNPALGGNFDFEISMGAPATGNAMPTAGFTFTTSDLMADFIDTSTDDGTIMSRSWDFGDGSPPSTDTNPSHPYGAGGNYNVTLTVTDDGGGVDSEIQPVTVSEPGVNNMPVAAFTADCNNLDCTFADASSDSDGTIDSWSWDFGDGNTSTAASPSHTYAAGTYNVTLTVTDNAGGSDSDTQSVTVAANLPPTAAFTSSTSDLTASFTDGSSDSDGTIASRSWDFGDGSPLSAATSPSHLYAAAGPYSVTLTVTDDDGDSGNVTQSVTVTEPVPNVAPVASFTVDRNPCGTDFYPNQCQFTDTSTDSDGNTVTWDWDFGGGAVIGGLPIAPGHQMLVQFPANGPNPVTVSLTVTDDDGATHSSVPMDLPLSHPSPAADVVHIADLDNMSVLAPRDRWDAAVSVLVRDNNGSPVSGATVDGTWSNGTSGGGSCATDASGQCTITKSKIKGNVSLVTFSVTSVSAGLDYSSAANTDPDGDSNGTLIDLAQPGVSQPLTASFTVDRDPCGTDFFPNTCMFTDTTDDPDASIVLWSWDIGDGNPPTESLTPDSQILVEFPADGPNPVTVILTVTDGAGATDSASMTLAISDPVATPPTAAFSVSCTDYNCAYVDGSSDDGSITGRSWVFGDGAVSSDTNPSHTYAPGGTTYTVTLEVTDNDAMTDMTSQDVTVPVTLNPLTLTATGYKVKGKQKVDLTWSGAAVGVDIFRDNGPIEVGLPSSGSYTDNIDLKGGASYIYKVCETGSTTVCSDPIPVVF